MCRKESDLVAGRKQYLLIDPFTTSSRVASKWKILFINLAEQTDHNMSNEKKSQKSQEKVQRY